MLLAASQVEAQQNPPGQPVPSAQTQDRIERQARRFGLGVQAGVGIDPEIIDLGVHGTFGPLFKPNVTFRPAVEVGVGELTTFVGLNFDVLYAFPGNRTDEGWVPYVGAGPTFGLSHRGFDTDGEEGVDAPDRFDFSDTDFNGGMTFIVGMRKTKGFFEMKATAWGVANIRLVAGYNF
jgi:hypothetical protein